MSFAKRMLEEQDERRSIVIELLVDVEAFERCEAHEEVFDAWGDYDEARRVGKQKIANDEDGFGRFKPAELDELIEELKNSHGDECSWCAKQAAE
jgi:hypothetical protein